MCEDLERRVACGVIKGSDDINACVTVPSLGA